MNTAILATVKTILEGGAGEFVGGLTLALLSAAGKQVAQKFRPPTHLAALNDALEFALINAFEETLQQVSGPTKYYLDSLADFLKDNVVQVELSTLLSRDAAFDRGVLRQQFEVITQGYSPDQIPDLDFDKFINTMEQAFYVAVKNTSILQPIIVVERLDELTDLSKRDIEVNEETVKTLQRIEMRLWYLHRDFVSKITEPLFSKRTYYGDDTFTTLTRHLQEWKTVHSNVQNLLFASEPVEIATGLLLRQQIEQYAYEVEANWFRYCEPKAARIRREFQSLQLIQFHNIDELVLLLEGPYSVVTAIQRLNVKDHNSLHQLRIALATLVDLMKQMLIVADHRIMHICEKLLDFQGEND